MSTTDADNLLTATVTGKRKREVGLFVPAKFTLRLYARNEEQFEERNE